MKKKIPLAWYRCPLCGHKEFEVLYVNPAAPALVSPQLLAWDVVTSVCTHCGLVQSNPRPRPQLAAKIYGQLQTAVDPNELAGEPPKLTGQALAIRKEQADYLASIPEINAGAAVLDIGCNHGFLLHELKLRGFETWGIEPDPILAAKAQSRGLRVITAFYENFRFAPESFDVITAFHVLEHTHDPRAFLKKARNELKQDGLLIVEVPDLSKPNAEKLDDFFNTQHIFHFTPTSLASLLEHIGFEPVETLEMSYYAFRILARKTNRRSRRTHDPDEVERARRIVQSYKAARLRTLTRISEIIAQTMNGLKPSESIAIWGAGKHTYELLRLTPLAQHKRFVFVDSSPQTQRHGFMGFAVLDPSELPRMSPELVVISSYAFQDEIALRLRDMGFADDRILKLYDEVKTYDGM